jgi:hypothetical protein
MFRFGILMSLGALGIGCIGQPPENHPATPEENHPASPVGPGASFPPLTLARNFQGDAGVAPLTQPDAGVPPPTEPDAGNIQNAAKVVAGMRLGFRECFQAALTRHGRLSASVRLSMQIGADGAIVRVTGKGTNTPAELIECLFDEVARHHFEPPAGGAAVVNVPVNLVAQ